MSFEDRRMKEQRRSMIKNDFQTTHLGAPLPHARRVARPSFSLRREGADVFLSTEL